MHVETAIAGAIGIALIGVIYALWLAWHIMLRPTGTKAMEEVAAAISDGASAYLERQFKTVAPFVVAIAAVIWVGLGPIGLLTALAFVLGAGASALAAYAGMTVAVRANVRTAEAARHGVQDAMALAFKGGGVTGMLVVGLALLGVAGLYWTVGNIIVLAGFGFGASLISLFARVGGGIFTKAADMGADLVGKLEFGIPEDDPRNPAAIADNIGDMVGDCAGTAADLFESYVVALIAAMVLAGAFGPAVMSLPLLMAGAGILASAAGCFVFLHGGRAYPLSWAVLASGVLAASFFGVIIDMLKLDVRLWGAGALGAAATIAIAYTVDFYTRHDGRIVRSVAHAGRFGPAANIVKGLSVGMRSTIIPVLIIAIATIAANELAGIFGLALAAVGMISTACVVLAIDSFGAIVDNAGGIARMAHLPPEVRRITDHLDRLGNSAKAITKGITIGSAAVCALALLAAVISVTGSEQITITNAGVMAGIFLGALVPLYLCGIMLGAGVHAAEQMVTEVRHQFRNIKDILKGKAKPDYARCIDVGTRAALTEIAPVGVFAIIAPLFVGMVLGTAALSGMLAGAIAVGLLLALALANAGYALDNAKKHVESYEGGNVGLMAASEVGDLVGDPLKDTAAPAINVFIKVMAMVALLAAIAGLYGLHLF